MIIHNSLQSKNLPSKLNNTNSDITVYSIVTNKITDLAGSIVIEILAHTRNKVSVNAASVK